MGLEVEDKNRSLKIGEEVKMPSRADILELRELEQLYQDSKYSSGLDKVVKRAGYFALYDRLRERGIIKTAGIEGINQMGIEL